MIKTIGIVLVAIGLVMIAYTGFNYITTEKVVDLACIIQAFSLMQIRGVELRRYSSLFQGVRNDVDVLK